MDLILELLLDLVCSRLELELVLDVALRLFRFSAELFAVPTSSSSPFFRLHDTRSSTGGSIYI